MKIKRNQHPQERISGDPDSGEGLDESEGLKERNMLESLYDSSNFI